MDDWFDDYVPDVIGHVTELSKPTKTKLKGTLGFLDFGDKKVATKRTKHKGRPKHYSKNKPHCTDKAARKGKIAKKKAKDKVRREAKREVIKREAKAAAMHEEMARAQEAQAAQVT